MINVLGDAYGAGIVEHLSRGDLAKADLLEQERLEIGGVEETEGFAEGDSAEKNHSKRLNSTVSEQHEVTTYC